jgi:hypothetical protein
MRYNQESLRSSRVTSSIPREARGDNFNKIRTKTHNSHP